MYFGGVAMETEEEMLEEIDTVKGKQPFKYLGVPLDN